MRDLIWTIILVWVAWRIIDAFRSFSAKKSRQQRSSGTNYQQTRTNYTNSNSEKKDHHLKPDAGEYIDYEEVK